MKKAFLLFALAAAIALTSCKSSKLISSTTNIVKSDSTYLEKDTVTVSIPGSQIQKDFSIGKVIMVPVPGKPGKEQPCVIIKNQLHSVADLKKIHTLQIFIDSLGNVSAISDIRARELEVEVLKQKRIIKEQSETIKVYEKRESWIKKFFRKMAYGILAVVVLVGIVFYYLQKFRPNIRI